MTMAIGRWSFAVLAVAVTGCGPVNTGHESSAIVDDAGSAALTNSATGDGLHCVAPIALAANTSLTDQHTPPVGEANAPCATSDAPQRFFRIDVPAHTRATITARPAALTCPWSIVMRAALACEANSCATEARDNGAGEPVALQIDNDGDVALVRVVSVSGTSAAEGGAFDIATGFETK
jgi:hypothetical protein